MRVSPLGSPGALALPDHSGRPRRSGPPNSATTKCFSLSTLERWYYASQRGGLEGLKPGPRNDKGRAQELTPGQRLLLCDIRREYPAASATTVRRLSVDEGLVKFSMRAGGGSKTRLWWQAKRPGALWHGDVCVLARPFASRVRQRLKSFYHRACSDHPPPPSKGLTRGRGSTKFAAIAGAVAFSAMPSDGTKHTSGAPLKRPAIFSSPQKMHALRRLAHAGSPRWLGHRRERSSSCASDPHEVRQTALSLTRSPHVCACAPSMRQPVPSTFTAPSVMVLLSPSLVPTHLNPTSLVV